MACEVAALCAVLRKKGKERNEDSNEPRVWVQPTAGGFDLPI
jgi:hypothetical protein